MSNYTFFIIFLATLIITIGIFARRYGIKKGLKKLFLEML